MFNCRRRVLDRYIYRSLCGNLIAAEDTWHFKAPYKNNHMNIRRKAYNIQTLSLSEHLRDDFGQTSFQWKTWILFALRLIDLLEKVKYI